MFCNLPREFACQMFSPKNREYNFVVLLNAVYGLVIYAGTGCQGWDVGCAGDIAVFGASVAVVAGVFVVYFKQHVLCPFIFLYINRLIC